ncbi:MAG: hypothetical protein FWD37_05330 [Methanomassiliicoccaceae archaeon]|nr:hypothetical protein [Methanomassiliicoccaceae archaeon]
MVQYDDIRLLEERAAEDISGVEVLLERVHDHPTLIQFHLQQFTEKIEKL